MLWVVNDSTTDKVFKYAVAGSLLGSWTIGSANSKPTGLTIDPANVSDIWIVDSGTDLVYQYTGAASRTSGGQTASATFALAAGNANPQGIADPPPTFRMATAPVATAAWIGRDAPFLTLMDQQSSVKKSDALRARQQIFDSLGSEERLAVTRASSPTAAADQADPPAPTVSGDHDAAVDLALEAAFGDAVQGYALATAA